jgi:hypothetical protein
MKNKTLITLLASLFCVSLSAQRFHGGLLGGINASQVDGDHWKGYNKIGLNFGAFVNTDFKEKWGGQFEIKYSGKGSSNSPKSEVKKMIGLRYVDVPVLITYQAKEKLQIQAGVSFNYLFNAMYYEGDWFDDWDIEPKKIETSIAFGVNYTLLRSLDLNARYSYSLMPIRSKFSTSDWGDGAWFNNVLIFALYYNIGGRD